MLKLPRHPAIWFSALALWVGLLWMLSSFSSAGPPMPVANLDKLAHFAYFLGGGILFAGCHFSLRPDRPEWANILASAIIAMALIGFLDEWHQCFTPGRSGADPWDWLADVLGGTAGALTLKWVHRKLE